MFHIYGFQFITRIDRFNEIYNILVAE